MSATTGKNGLRMPFAEWLFRMAEADVPYQARSLAISAAVFNVAGTHVLARLTGIALNGRADKTFATWRAYLVRGGWIVIEDAGGGSAPHVRLRPAYQGLLVEFDERVEVSPLAASLPASKSQPKKLHCSTELRERVRRAFDYTCQRCGFRCAPGERRTHKGRNVTSSFLTVDRIVPGSKGGTYVDNNVTLACRDCNCRRRDVLEPVGISLASVGGAQ